MVGLTGGIASGKSTVGAMLASRGATLIDADQLARRATAPGTPTLAEVLAEFGEEVEAADGSLDRGRLGQIVFSDPKARRRLEAIVHPRVAALSRQEIEAARRRGAELIVYDVPLLFETGRQREVQASILVWVDPATQLQRLCRRDGLRPEEARRRIESQMPLDQKRALATWVIDNRGQLTDTERQVAGLWAAEFDHSRGRGGGGTD